MGGIGGAGSAGTLKTPRVRLASIHLQLFRICIPSLWVHVTLGGKKAYATHTGITALVIALAKIQFQSANVLAANDDAYELRDQDYRVEYVR